MCILGLSGQNNQILRFQGKTSDQEWAFVRSWKLGRQILGRIASEQEACQKGEGDKLVICQKLGKTQLIGQSGAGGRLPTVFRSIFVLLLLPDL